jgi:hypothetical protein
MDHHRNSIPEEQRRRRARADPHEIRSKLAELEMEAERPAAPDALTAQ